MKKNRLELFQSSVIDWFISNGRRFPWRETRDPFRILVAQVVIRLTGAQKAEKVYKHLVYRFNTPKQLAKANVRELTSLFKPLGLHNRASLLVEIARQLNKQFNDTMPNTYAELISLKGVGQYTANAIMCLAYGERVPMVDTRVLRIFERCFGLIQNKGAYKDKELWRFASELLPITAYREYNLGLLDIGTLVCRRAEPNCTICPISMVCIKRDTNSRLAITNLLGR